MTTVTVFTPIIQAPWLPPAGAMFKLLLAFGIAAAKTSLVFVFFMQLRYQNGLVRVFSLAGFFWLALIAVLASTDYLMRH